MNELVLGTGDLSLTADEGESLLVKEILCSSAASAHATVTVGQRTVANFRVSGALGNHLAFPPGGGNPDRGTGISLTRMLFEAGLWRGIPIPSGYTLTLDGIAQSGAVQCVIYDRYDEGDITRTQANGPESNELDYIIYGDSGATISTAGDHHLDNPVNGSEFDAFPFGVANPANTTTTFFGVLASPFAPSENDGTDDIGTRYLKLTRQRTVLGDKDRNGFLLFQALGNQSVDQVGDGQSVIGNYNDVDNRPPLLFTPPLVFEGGEELLVELNTNIANSGANMLVTDQEVGFIARQVRG